MICSPVLCYFSVFFFFFTDPATTEIYTLSLHDALPISPPREERRTFEAPTLVIGHRYDAIHPFSDAGMLADELPNGRLLQAWSLLELRVAPTRLTNEIAAFLDECWKPAAAPRRRRASG